MEAGDTGRHHDGGLLVVGSAGYRGIAKVGASVNEIGVVRLPSIQGLLVMSEGQTAVAAATLYAGTYSNDFQAQAKFAEAIEMRKKAWQTSTVAGSATSRCRKRRKRR
jgi:hypothetical protein